MAKTNRWKTYKISKSLNGDKIVYLARAGKNKKIIGRGGSISQLDKIMKEAARKFDEEQAEIAKLAEEKEAKLAEKLAKKPGLWKPGGLLKKKPATTSKATSKTKKPTKTTTSKKVNVTTESL